MISLKKKKKREGAINVGIKIKNDFFGGGVDSQKCKSFSAQKSNFKPKFANLMGAHPH